MKTKLITASLLAMAGVANAQWDNFSGANNTTGPIGINAPGGPVYQLDISLNNPGGDGIRIAQNGFNGESTIRMENNTMGGHNHAIFSLGNGNMYPGAWELWDYTTTSSLLFFGANGYAGINNETPIARLHVIENNPSTTSPAYGILGEATGNGFESIGVLGHGFGTGGQSMGGAFTAGGGISQNIGVYGNIYDDNASFNTGVYGDSYNFANAWAGWFQGNVYATGAYFASDKNLKRNIKPMVNSLDVINKLNPVDYEFDTESNKNMSLPSVKQHGFLSQEVEQVLPELTLSTHTPAKMDNKGNVIAPGKDILTLNYNGFIAILTKGIQEQQKMITDLKAQVTDLQLQVSKTTGINTNVDANGYAMYQNEPNPFSGETVIKYNLGNQVSSASLVVYDLTGKQLTSLPIERGSSSITVTSEKLAAGIYIYSIIADGKVVDSKRMIVAEK